MFYDIFFANHKLLRFILQFSLVKRKKMCYTLKYIKFLGVICYENCYQSGNFNSYTSERLR